MFHFSLTLFDHFYTIAFLCFIILYFLNKFYIYIYIYIVYLQSDTVDFSRSLLRVLIAYHQRAVDFITQSN
jgi:hypothetical protein